MSLHYSQTIQISNLPDECVFQLESGLRFKVSPVDRMLIVGNCFGLSAWGYLMFKSKGPHKGKYLHRVICPSEFETDHRDLDIYNNRRDNLRPATRSQQRMNASFRRTTTGIKGVDFHIKSGRYRARIQTDGKSITLGFFPTVEQASEARQIATRRYHGEFGRNS